ncbi:glycosyltransferase family 25 protein [Pseudorhodoplanes sp.]|jgi:glycosyl transferase family 25|uniref:glycosyltransferase family 25 protein n=1 Tax=Pseudorhodoplanes sp. TaxID=1934341 RepID=UPI002D102457|nr:glycosyltransferase family 25 protein [Pseudorhodoplanes sp.]HWV40119.1 glycosyltransferase family 25 protein [Pseudorhodoplanes sp.]
MELDAVYVLSVKSFTERHQHIRQQLAAYDIPFEFIFDFDPDQLQEDGSPQTLSRAHKSLILKHRCAWERACANALEKVLIFEDDVILKRNFASRLHAVLESVTTLEPGWLVFLGGADSKLSDRFFLDPSLLIPHPISTAEAYITDNVACCARLDWLSKNTSDLPADHLLRHIDSAVGIQQYWPRDALLVQGSINGRFSSTLDGSRRKHSDFVNWMRFQWQRFQRRKLRKWFIQAVNLSSRARF